MLLKTLNNADLLNKQVLLRCDFNVPINKDLRITDDTKIRKSLPTINAILNDNPTALILLSHFGRPDGKVVDNLSLKPIAARLEFLLKKPVKLISDISKSTLKLISKHPGNIYIYENTRFHPEEEINSPDFAKKLASLGDIFINDAFGTTHRAHASTVGITEFLPSYAGLLLESEIKALSPLLENPKKPYVSILGGAKISSKIGLIKHFLKISDHILLGGALVNTLFQANNINIGQSLSEPEAFKLVSNISLDNPKLVLPIDNVCAPNIDSKNITPCNLNNSLDNLKIFDIGPNTISKFSEIISNAATIVWNGPLGLFEKQPFDKGTNAIALAIAKNKTATSIIGGGDTISAIKHLHINSDFTHISTGGGAMLEFLEGKQLPGIVPLLKN